MTVWAEQRLANNKMLASKTSSRVLGMEKTPLLFFFRDIEQPVQSQPWDEAI
jgi:hypothetical protein